MKNYILSFLISLYGLIPFLPNLGVLDIINVHHLFYSVLNIFSSIFLLLFRNKLKLLGNKYFYLAYLLFLFLSLLSVAYSRSIAISLVDFRAYLTIFFSFINLSLLFQNVGNPKKLFLWIFITLLTAEVFYIIIMFFLTFDINNPYGRTYIFQGLTYNLNIAAFSILIKTPFLYYLIYRSDLKKLFFLSILLIASYFVLFANSSRGAILTLFTVSILLLFFVILKRNLLKTSVVNLLCIVFAYGLHSYFYKNQESLKLENRITNLSDDSSSMRLRFYDSAIEHFKKNFFGSGIGTWKVNSIEYERNHMADYQVPYHAHNDFLHLLTEIGLPGSLSYLLIFLTFLIFQVHKLYFQKGSHDEVFTIAIILGFIIYSADAMLNFPRIRGFSQMNLIFIFSIGLLENKYSHDLTLKKFLNFIVCLSPILIYYNFKLFKNSKDQVLPYVEYNITKSLDAPLESILSIEERFNPINSTTVPFKNIKANYLYEAGMYEKAIKFAREGKKINPYLYMAENQIAQSYLKKGIIDSASYYAKIAFDSLPNNNLHVTTYQQALYKSDFLDKKVVLEELQRVYSKYLSFNRKLSKSSPIIHANHLKGIIFFNEFENFTEEQKRISKKALTYYPENKELIKFNSIIQNGLGKVGLSNDFNNKAQTLFENKKFNQAISIWEEATKLLPNEEAYYLNIAQSYAALGKTKKSLEFLSKIQELEIKGNSGKFEFLLALNYIELGDYPKACNYLKTSFNLGYKESINTLKALKCF